MKKLALVASAATALICAASLIATPAEAKKHHKKQAAPAAQQTAMGPGMAPMAGPRHDGGYPVKSGNMCWKEIDTSHDRGYWDACPKKK